MPSLPGSGRFISRRQQQHESATMRLYTENERLRKENEELRKDKERMDWLSTCGYEITVGKDADHPHIQCRDISIRPVIDAEIRAAARLAKESETGHD